MESVQFDFSLLSRKMMKKLVKIKSLGNMLVNDKIFKLIWVYQLQTLFYVRGIFWWTKIFFNCPNSLCVN